MENYIESMEYFNESMAICEMEFDANVKFESAMVTIEYMEEAGGIGDKIHTLITKAVEGIKKMIGKIIDFIQSKVFKTKLDKAEDAVKNNPQLKNAKVKITDYDKLEKLSESTRKELLKTKDPDEVMEKYKKQRNRILAASAAITVTLGGLLMWMRKSNKQSFEAMEEMYKDDLYTMEKKIAEEKAIRDSVNNKYIAKKYEYEYQKKRHTEEKQTLLNKLTILNNAHDKESAALREDNKKLRESNSALNASVEYLDSINGKLYKALQLMKTEISDKHAKLNDAVKVIDTATSKDAK